MTGSSSGDTLSAVELPGPGTIVTTFVPRRVNTMDAVAHEQVNGTFYFAITSSKGRFQC